MPKTYHEMAQAARTMNEDSRAQMALLLLRIYEADRTQNNGFVTGEAVICGAFASEAKHILTEVGVLTSNDNKVRETHRYTVWVDSEDSDVALGDVDEQERVDITTQYDAEEAANLGAAELHNHLGGQSYDIAVLDYDSGEVSRFSGYFEGGGTTYSYSASLK